MIAPLLILSLRFTQFQANSSSPVAGIYSNYTAPDANYLTVNYKTGDTVSGVVHFKVIVHTDAIVTKVEFYQAGSLASYQSSTPYQFDLDSTILPDGPYKVKFIAYLDSGASVTQELTLTVNNGLTETPAAHVEKGKKLLGNDDAKGAIEEARIALRIDDKNVPAKLLLAQSFYKLQQYDQAQNYCDEILGDNPNNLNALDLASAIGVKEAFAVVAQAKQGDQGVQLTKQALDYAIDNRNKYLKLKFNALNINTTDPYVFASAANKAHQYSLAVQVMTPVFNKNMGSVKAANLLAYSQFEAGRFADASATLDLLKKANGDQFTAYTKALQALLAARANDNSTADKILGDAILDDMSDLGVQTAQASIALEEKNTSALANLLQAMSQDSGQLIEVNYLMSAVADQIGNYDVAKQQLQQGLLADASWDTLYVEAGNQLLSSSLNRKVSDEVSKAQYKVAQMYFQEGLRAKGDSFRALTGLAIVSALMGKPADSLRYAQDSVKANPNYAAGQLALSMALSLNGNSDNAQASNDANTALTKAGQLDPTRLSGSMIPSAVEAWSYFASGGRALVITAP